MVALHERRARSARHHHPEGGAGVSRRGGRLVEEIFVAIRRLREAGTTIFLVDQNARAALAIADRGYVLETGRIVLAGGGAELAANAAVKRAYLGL
jgi:ABC-type branched-subunit amino acid transport system ATPase component